MSDPSAAGSASSSRIAFVVDSTCDLPAAVVYRYGIKVVPLYVLFGSQSYRDGIDIDPGTFYERLQRDKVYPATSQPSSQDFSQAFAEVFESRKPGAIVCVTLSGKLSGTINAARSAAATFTACPVTILDSNTVSMGLGMTVLAGATAAEQGASLNEVLTIMQQRAKQIEVYFTLNTLDYLHHGGRIGSAQRLIGTALSIKPMLGIRDGLVVPVENVRTRRRALARLAELARCMSDTPGALDIALVSATTREESDPLADSLGAELSPAHLYRAAFSPVIGVHTGPGTIGIVICPAAQPASGADLLENTAPVLAGVGVR